MSNFVPTFEAKTRRCGKTKTNKYATPSIRQQIFGYFLHSYIKTILKIHIFLEIIISNFIATEGNYHIVFYMVAWHAYEFFYCFIYFFYICYVFLLTTMWYFFSYRFEKHWFPNIPSKGQGYRCIRVNCVSPVDLTLQMAASKCGLAYSDLRLPTELTVWVDPNEVCYRWVFFFFTIPI